MGFCRNKPQRQNDRGSYPDRKHGILNDNAPTHFSTHRTFTHVDVVMCSASIAPRLTCSTLDCLHGSDHFPLVTQLMSGTLNPGTPKPKFKTDNANWSKFQSVACDIIAKTPKTCNINKEAGLVHKAIRMAAHYSIPQTHS